MTSSSTTTSSLSALAAAMAVCVVEEPAAEARRSWSWALSLWGAGVDDIPLSVVHDLGFLLLRGRALRLRTGRIRKNGHDVVITAGDVAHDVAEDFDRARRARLQFEERVMAAGLRDPSVLTASVLMAGSTPVLQDQLVTHALAEMWPRLKGEKDWPRQSVPFLRAQVAADVDDASADDDDGVIADHDVVAFMAAFAAAAADLDDVAAAGVGGSLLLPDEVWELSRLDVLPSEAMRLALRAVHRTMNGIGAMSSAVMMALRDRRANAVTDDVDADAFPAGGFDAMSTKGALENLVRSEVAYVGVGNEHDASAPDLFDVRYVEGETLYYTRDESPLLERRRVLNVAIVEVERARAKLAELPTQTVVLIEAVILAAFKDLQLVFGSSMVQLQLAIDGDADAVAEELGLVSASLDSELAHRRAVLVPIGGLPADRRVVFSPRPPDATSKVGTQLWVRVGEAQWTLSTHPVSPQHGATFDPRRDLRRLADILAAFA
jgi:hypothetical protein